MTRDPRQPRPRPAPPYGYAGRPMPPRRTYRGYAHEADDVSTATGGRMAAVLLALAVGALVITHGLWQITAPAPAGRLLRTVLLPLTDLDQTLAANLENLREAASGQPPDGRVTVPGLPIAVQVTREEAEGDPDALRSVVLRRMSDAVYEQGAAAFRAPGAEPPSPTILTSQWAVQRSFDFLTADQHASLRMPRLIALIATLVLAVLTIWLLEGPARLSGPGVSVIVGSVIGALFALGMRLVANLFYGEETVGDEIVRLVARGASTTVLVVAGTFFVFGVVLAVLGALAGRWDQAQPETAPVGRGESRRVPGRRGD
jgi:hypothetical protein